MRWELRPLAQPCRYAGCRMFATVELGSIESGDAILGGADWAPYGAYCQAHGHDMLRDRVRRSTLTSAAPPKPEGT